MSAGDVALITGAASGIGAATARAFAEDGWTVYATDRSDDLDDAAAAGCETAVMDVTDDAAIRRMVERIDEETGGVDCLVNNAGYCSVGPIEETSIDAGRRQFDVNLHGTLRLVDAVLPAMRDRGRGTIVNVSSVLGRVTPPGVGLYSASKHALEAVSDALRVETAGTGVDVVVVEPAWVDTRFNSYAMGELDDVDVTGDYEAVHALYREVGLLDGGRLAVSPDRVAETVLGAARSPSPDSRYVVGTAARLVIAVGWLPDAVSDRLYSVLLRAARRFS